MSFDIVNKNILEIDDEHLNLAISNYFCHEGLWNVADVFKEVRTAR